VGFIFIGKKMTEFAEDLVKELKKVKKVKPFKRKTITERGIPLETIKTMTRKQIKDIIKSERR